MQILTPMCGMHEGQAQGGQIWAKNRSDWRQMGQTRDFFISDSSHFGIESNVLNHI